MTAPSWPDLCRSFSAEVNQYVRPIFQLLHQEQAAFAVDRRTEFEVLSPLWKSDAATSNAADSAVAGLRADSYAEREAAMNRLRQLGEPAALYLMTVDTRSWSLEQAMRVDQFLSAYRPLGDDDAAKLRRDPSFLLDCLYDSDPAVRRLAVEQLRQVTGRKIDPDPSVGEIGELRRVLVPAATQP